MEYLMMMMMMMIMINRPVEFEVFTAGYLQLHAVGILSYECIPEDRSVRV
jgi:hypothetical protein